MEVKKIFYKRKQKYNKKVVYKKRHFMSDQKKIKEGIKRVKKIYYKAIKIKNL